jgi:hypothetical protein
MAIGHEGAGAEQSTDGIRWLKWSDEAFLLAQREEKPVLLDIFGHWCHWCHVMDETTYENPDVVELVERLYVPVRVDTDRFPDINDRYNQGGWPTTAILTPSGHVLYGATYLPPEQMAQVLLHVATAYAEQHEEIQRRIATHERDDAGEPVLGAGTPVHAVEVTLTALKRAFDPVNGGFGAAPKFPQPGALDFALTQYALGARSDMAEIVLGSLHGMLPLLDPVGGGFHRYSTTANWRVPHYEKMLEGNGCLLGTYADAYRAFGEQRLADAVRSVARYLEATLLDQATGAFRASQDADVFSHDPQRETVPGEEFFSLDARRRAQIGEPYVDPTLIAPYNAMAIDGLVRAYLALGADAYLRTAQGAADFLMSTMRRDDGAIYHYYDGAPHRPGLLATQVWTATALLDLHEVTGEAHYLAGAQSAVSYALTHLWSEQGGLWDVPADTKAPGLLRHRDKPVIDNARAAVALLRLSHHLGDDSLLKRAHEALRVGATGYARYGFMAGDYAYAAWLLSAEPRLLRIVASPEQSREWAQAALRTYVPGLTVVHLDPDRDGARLQAEGLAADVGAAYLCVGRRCHRARTADELPELLKGLSPGLRQSVP